MVILYISNICHFFSMLDIHICIQCQLSCVGLICVKVSTNF